MDAERLFLARCKTLAALAESGDEVELLDMAGHLRQLLLDKHSLVDSVNKGSGKVKLTFHVGKFDPPPHPQAVLASLEDGIDPHTRRPGAASALLSRMEFMNHVIAYVSGQPISIMEAIKFAAHVAGGRHHDPYPKGKDKIVSDFSQSYHIGGLPFGIRAQKAIARVVLRGLDPLIQTVRSKVDSR